MSSDSKLKTAPSAPKTVVNGPRYHIERTSAIGITRTREAATTAAVRGGSFRKITKTIRTHWNTNIHNCKMTSTMNTKEKANAMNTTTLCTYKTGPALTETWAEKWPHAPSASTAHSARRATPTDISPELSYSGAHTAKETLHKRKKKQTPVFNVTGNSKTIWVAQRDYNYSGAAVPSAEVQVRPTFKGSAAGLSPARPRLVETTCTTDIRTELKPAVESVGTSPG